MSKSTQEMRIQQRDLEREALELENSRATTDGRHGSGGPDADVTGGSPRADTADAAFDESVREILQRTPGYGGDVPLARLDDLGLARHALEIGLQGYTVVPPEVTGITSAQVDRLVELLLAHTEMVVGCRFSVEEGPEAELDYGGFPGYLELQSGAKPSQLQVTQLCTLDRAFRDLAVNPAAVALMEHLLGVGKAQFSSHNCFVKWTGEGYGDSLGLHLDQQPWGRPITANATWALTEYTKENGALAVVPGSHRRDTTPGKGAAAEAVPVECPAGSLIAWDGQLWHGAYPKTTPGLRVTISNYFRHQSLQPQDDIPNSFPQELADDCVDPDTFKRLAGFGLGPYTRHMIPYPKAVRR